MLTIWAAHEAPVDVPSLVACHETPVLTTSPNAHHARQVARMSQEPAECVGTGWDDTGLGGISRMSPNWRLARPSSERRPRRALRTPDPSWTTRMRGPAGGPIPRR